jgi:hypothetical protein
MKLSRILSLVLAAALQVMPMLRAVIPVQFQALMPSSWAFVLRLASGSVAFLGSYHAVSGATSIVGPYTIAATQGVPYTRQLGTSGQTAESWSAVPNPIAPGLNLNTVNGLISGTPTRAGTYTPTITAWRYPNNQGDHLSVVFTVTVAPPPSPPKIVTALTNQTALEGAKVTFSLLATGTPTLRYRWRFNGTNIAGATNFSLQLTNVHTTNTGSYSIIVTNPYGAATSTATLVVNAATPPAILTQPQSQMVPAGSNATFAVSATGTGLAYFWQWNTAPLSVTSGPQFTLTNVSPAQSGLYSVTVSNSAGSILSSNAHLLVVPPPSLADAPRIVLQPVAGGLLPLSFATAAGYRYLVQASDSLTSSNWVVVTNIPPSFDGGTVNLTQPTANIPGLFYRVLLQPQ